MPVSEVDASVTGAKPQSFNLAAFVTDDADLDHFTPILHKYRARDPRARVDLIVADYSRSYRQDFRIRYLASIGVNVRHVVEALGIGPRLQTPYFALAGSRVRPLRAVARIWRLVLGHRRLFGSSGYAERFFATEPGRSTSVILHNHYLPSLAALSQCARRAGVASVAVPHAADNFDNRMIHERMRNYPVPPAFPAAPGDRIIAVSAITRDLMVANGRTTADRINVLGSARFCAEWQQVLARIVPPVSVAARDGDFKILVFVGKPESNLFEAEVVRIIDTIRRLPRVHVAVKLHTRTPMAARIEGENVQFFDRESPSRALIDWADVTLFSATSTIVDNVVLDRPVLFLRRTVNSIQTSERFMRSWAVDCRDDLCETILRLQAGQQCRTYSAQERDALIRALVEPAGPDVLNLYIDEIERVTRTARAAPSFSRASSHPTRDR